MPAGAGGGATSATAGAQGDIVAAVHTTNAVACKTLVRRASPTERRVRAVEPADTRFLGFLVARAVADTRWHMACQEFAARGDGWNSLAVGIITVVFAVAVVVSVVETLFASLFMIPF